KDNTRIESVTISYDVTSIGAGAFSGCTALKDIQFSGALQQIGNRAFENCGKLETIFLGPNVTSIGNGVFDGCFNLSEIEVSEPNTAYRTVEGVLYDKAMTRLIKYPPRKTNPFYAIVSSVKTIDSRAFFQCTALEGVLCYDSATDIGTYAFGYYWDEETASVLKKEDLLIRGVEGSAAQQYAKDNGFAFKGIFDYIILEDGSARLTKYYGNDREVRFPSEVGGKKVTSIAEEICQGDTTIEKLIIPDTVFSIGSRAFANCTKLKSVTLGSRVADMAPAEVFAGCRLLSDIQVSDLNQNFSAKDGNLYNKNRTELYLSAKDNTAITLEDGVLIIGRNAFYDRGSLTNVTLPSTLTLIRENAFFGCKGIRRIVIPYSVKTIGDRAIGYYKNGSLTVKQSDLVIEGYFGTAGESYAKANGFAFEGKKPGGTCGDCRWEFDAKTATLTISGEGKVAQNNKSDVSGEPWAAFANNITKLVIGNGVTEIGTGSFRDLTAVKEITIGKSVETIGEFAFCGCTGLNGIVIPDNVLTIKGWAFEGCSTLSSVTLGVNLKKIGDKAFFRCPQLKEVAIPANVKQIGDESFGFGQDDVRIAGFKIRGVVGSQAQAYAVDNQFTFLIQDAADQNKDREQVRFLPAADQADCTVKLVIRDDAGEYHIYDMSSTGIAYDGVKVQSAYIPKDLNATYVQFQIYDGTLLKKTVDLSRDQFKAAKDMIITADGKTFDESKHTPDGGKIANPITVKVAKKTVKASALSKKAQKVKALTVENAKGKVTFKLVKKGTNKKIYSKLKLNKKGVISIKKGKLKKGSYKIKVKITASGNATYKKTVITKTITVKIK
nr:leucine-rich repeat domain-containing protein [Lachnospiraceae bacterium]